MRELYMSVNGSGWYIFIQPVSMYCVCVCVCVWKHIYAKRAKRISLLYQRLRMFHIRVLERHYLNVFVVWHKQSKLDGLSIP